MATRLLCCAAALFGTLVTAAAAQESPNLKRGGEVYRNCVPCHSLQPDVNLTGPSLADVVGRRAGAATGFARYSSGLKSATFIWDDDTLNAWFADPLAMIPGTSMIFRGLNDDKDRADLIAFLKVATAAGGAEAVVAQGLVPARAAIGQRPEPLAGLPPEQLVTKIRHCGDTYFITTASGRETPFWEMNVRLKLDTQDTGPAEGNPAIIGAGMTGDRVSVIFSSLADLTKFVVEEC